MSPHFQRNEAVQPLATPLLRVATVPFCNAWPLTRFLPDLLPNLHLSTWFPSSMRNALITNQVDIALMPVAELSRIPNAAILSNACVASHGPVQSVLLYSRKPIEQIQTIALDAASRTSITLAQVILREFYAVQPKIIPFELDQSPESVESDAFVVIGDRALTLKPGECWKHRIDLGECWTEKTGLPFVFATWIARKSLGPEQDEIVRSLEKARDRGITSISRIISEAEIKAGYLGTPLFLERSALQQYLERSIHYKMDEEARKGLHLFLKWADGIGDRG
ncbi:MAG: menaquinone biosynthetic enzyme MqnA/MqnD family protein [Thermoguttaceae bacterium]